MIAKPSSNRVEQAALVKTIGTRCREARELCNISQSVAAKRFGYSNPSKLSKVEGATDTNSVPLWLIARAAKVYEVSVDYIFGATDDWETGSRMSQERAISGWMFDAWDKQRSRDMDVIHKIHKKVDAIDTSIASMLDAAGEANAALARFGELNPDFEDMRGGSRLVSAIGRVSDAAKSAKAKMTRIHFECKVVSPVTSQLSLLI